MKKFYKTIHVTTEFGDIKIGGIGTVVNNLYKNRNEDEGFIFVVRTSKGIGELGPDILVIEYDEYLKLKELPIKCNTAIFHSFQLLGISNLKLDNIYSVYVMHSNIIIESYFGGNGFLDIDKAYFIRTIQMVNEVVVVSNYEKEILISLIKSGTIPLNNGVKVSVIHNGIDVLNNNKIEIKRNKRLGYLGRLDIRKGIFRLFEQFNKTNNCLLLVATGGSENYDIKNKHMFAHYMNMCNKNIIPVGYCEHDRLNNFFNNIDALIIPSFYEPFGMTVIEAMQKGIPVISCNFGGPFEILGESYPLYYEINDDGDLSDLIDRFYNMNDEEITKIIQDNYNKLNNFSIEKMINNYRLINS